ncbi:MAG: hypothetical protein RR646_06940 [Erysipelotrichaceae bacterium]
MNKIKLKNTLLSLIIIFIFTIGLVPLNVNASTINILYNGVSINEGDTKIGDGKIVFDKTNNTLTLDNVNLTQSNPIKTVLEISGNPTDKINIILSGNNSITTTGEQSAIKSNISVNIEGTGNLCINTSYNERETNAISVSGDLNISNTNINLMGKNSLGGTAIYCDKTLTINKGTIHVESFLNGLIAENSYFNIRDSSINFQRVHSAMASYSDSDELSTLYNTDINVVGLWNMGVIVSSYNLLIDECNFDTLEAVSTMGIGGGHVTIKNSSIKLKCDQAAIKGDQRVDIIDSNLILNVTYGSGIDIKGLLSILNSDIYIKADGFTPVYAHKEQAITLPRNDLIVLDKNLEEVNNYKVSTSEYRRPSNTTSLYDSIFTIDGLPLKEDSSNAAKELHLRVKKADYTGVDTAISSIPKDLSIYSTTSVNSLNAIVNAVVRDLKITEQATVDKYANDINKAINDLRIKAPTMSEGNNQTIVEGNDAIFRSDAKLQDFIKAMVDGKDVDKSNYELVSGSTILTLKKSYLNGLSTGTHTLSIVSKNGTATANFTTKKNSKPILPKPVDPVTPVTPVTPLTPGVPDTGISTNYNLMLSIMLISIIGIFKIRKSSSFKQLKK